MTSGVRHRPSPRCSSHERTSLPQRSPDNAVALQDRLAPPALNLCVFSLGGERCEVSADQQWRVRDLKVALEQTLGVPVHQQRLLFESKELEDDMNLALQLPPSDSLIQVMLVKRPLEQAEWLAKLERDPHALRRAPGCIQDDRQVVLAAIQQDALALRHASPNLRGDKEVVLAALRRDGEALKYASDELKADKAIVMAAIEKTGKALHAAAENLRADRDFIIEAASQDASASLLRYAPTEVREDRNVILAALRRNWQAIHHVPRTFLEDEEVVNTLGLQSLEALRYVAANAGHQAGMPQEMIGLCKGKGCEFGARILLPNMPCTPGTDTSVPLRPTPRVAGFRPPRKPSLPSPHGAAGLRGTSPHNSQPPAARGHSEPPVHVRRLRPPRASGSPGPLAAAGGLSVLGRVATAL